MPETLSHFRNVAESSFIIAQCRAALALHAAKGAVSYRKVGGIRFVKVGRVHGSWSVSKGRMG